MRPFPFGSNGVSILQDPQLFVSADPIFLEYSRIHLFNKLPFIEPFASPYTIVVRVSSDYQN